MFLEEEDIAKSYLSLSRLDIKKYVFANSVVKRQSVYR